MTINDKIRRARDLYAKFGPWLRRESGISRGLDELRAGALASSRMCVQTGVADLCRRCDEQEGGSCCGAGIENRYTPEMLLINLLLGVDLPEKRISEKSCHFLGHQGCILTARDVLCINYLCLRLQRDLPAENLFMLQQATGLEMESIFILHNAIRNFIRREES